MSIGAQPKLAVDVCHEARFFLLHGQPHVLVEGIGLAPCGSKFNKSLNFGILVLVLGHAGGCQLN